jgi:hypothetical protein
MRNGPAGWRRRIRTGLGGGMLLSVGWVTAAGSLGLGDSARAAIPAGTCSAPQLSATTNKTGGTIAGFVVSGSAAAYRYEVDSPGLLPVGDPQKGNITELDVPYARENVSSGPLVASLGSAAYPGDTAAGIGSALGEFGAKGFPNDPVLATAAYPPSPNNPATSSYPPGGETSAASAGAAAANADQNGGGSSASLSSYQLGSSSSPATSGGPANSQSVVHLGAACVDASSQSAAQGVTVAGIVHIASVSGSAQAMSDGRTGVPAASLRVGDVTVAGLAAYIDRHGVHLASQQPVGYGVVQQVQSALNSALADGGLTIKLISPETSVQGGQAVASSGGVDLVVQQTLPAVGVPGVPSITVPGEPPIPLGTPGAPVRYQLTLGEAQATVDATSAPAFSSGSSGGTSAPAAGGGSSSSAPVSSGPPTISSLPGAAAGSAPAGAAGTPSSAYRPAPASLPTSSSVPLGWVIIAVLVSFMAAGPLLGYARWQLLEGRI